MVPISSRRGAGAEHCGCGSVPNEIGSAGWWVLDPCGTERPSNNIGYSATRSQRSEWCVCAEKDSVNRDARAFVFQIFQHRIARVLWQRQPDIPPSLASHQKRGLLPVDIGWTHAGDVAGAKPQSEQQQHDGSIPRSQGPILAARIIEAGGLPGVEVSRQRGQLPLRHGGQSMVEARLTDATCCQESQVDSERANKRLRVSGPPAADLVQNDRSYRGGGVLAGVSTECRKHLLQQVLVAINGYRRQSPMLQEPFAEGDQRAMESLELSLRSIG